MAKKQIHEQSQALSAYFDDMLTAPAKPEKKSARIAEPPAGPSVADLPDSEQAESIKRTVDERPAAIQRPESLRVLLCEIDDMPFALPVSMLNNIIPWPEHGLDSTSSQTAWQLGLYQQKQHQSQILDIRSLLQSENSTAPVEANYILLVDDRRYGIACQHIKHVVSYPSQAISWRDDLSEHPWLIGEVGDEKYQILDIYALLAVFEQR
ncbi:chemotaxis protein CheW [Methylophaga sp.]|uniref:chemotaxis protein CheW n=1 Tax=Methylophaga sp. TaxID=2024840 RepID=UPI003F69A7D3